MARPLKTGLEYFGVDIDMDEDDKIIDYLEEMGTNTGIGALWQLLNAIYKQSYYIEWNSSLLKKLGRKKHLEKSEMETAVNLLTGSKLSYIERQENSVFFNYDMYKNFNILTSRGIQKRYLIASARRAKILFDRRFILLDYSEQTQPHSERVNGKYEIVDKKGFWTELDTKFYLLNFITNGLISDSTNGVIVNTNLISDNTNTAQNEKLQPSKKNVNKSTQRDSTVQDIDSKETLQDIDKDKDSNIVKTPKAELAAQNESSLYQSIWKTFLSKNNKQFTDYGKEGKAVKGLIKKAETRFPDDPAGFIKAAIETYFDLIRGNDKYWNKHPFIPSRLNSSGVWDSLLVEMKNQEEESQPLEYEIDEGIIF